MHRSTSSVLTIAFAICLTACAVSVDAVVSDTNATFDQRLIGNWVDADDPDARATVTRESPTSYRIMFTDDGKTGKFEARLGRLGARMVLDVWPEPADSEIAEPYRGALIPGHLLFVVEIGADRITAATLDTDSLRAAIKAGRLKLDTLRANRQMILTGPTDALRAALPAHLARPGAVEKPAVFRRVRR
jgi:hypothetical protein